MEERDRQIGRERERQTDRQTDRDRETETETESETESEREREREREREKRERKGGGEGGGGGGGGGGASSLMDDSCQEVTIICGFYSAFYLALQRPFPAFINIQKALRSNRSSDFRRRQTALCC